MELIKDYDLEVHYHPGKVNVVADALNRKGYANEVQVASKSSELCAALKQLSLSFVKCSRVGDRAYIGAGDTQGSVT